MAGGPIRIGDQAQSRPRSPDYAEGWRDAVGHTRPPQIISLEWADEMLVQCETAFASRPANARTDMLVPAEVMHELLVVWKMVRKTGGAANV